MYAFNIISADFNSIEKRNLIASESINLLDQIKSKFSNGLERRVLFPYNRLFLSMIAPRLMRLQFELMIQSVIAEIVKKVLIPIMNSLRYSGKPPEQAANQQNDPSIVQLLQKTQAAVNQQGQQLLQNAINHLTPQANGVQQSNNGMANSLVSYQNNPTGQTALNSPQTMVQQFQQQQQQQPVQAQSDQVLLNNHNFNGQLNTNQMISSGVYQNNNLNNYQSFPQNYYQSLLNNQSVNYPEQNIVKNVPESGSNNQISQNNQNDIPSYVNYLPNYQQSGHQPQLNALVNTNEAKNSQSDDELDRANRWNEILKSLSGRRIETETV